MKFPRTYHLPFSPGASSDDKIHTLTHLESNFIGRDLVITEKLDGENQCWSIHDWHLRSESSNSGGILRSKSKAKWAEVRWQIPEEEFWFVEDISNKHSIEYQDHSNEFFLIAIYDRRRREWGDYSDINHTARKAGILPAPLISAGIFSSVEELKTAISRHVKQPSTLGGDREGVVVMPYDYFEDWTASTAKWVRANHVQTDQHWTQQRLREVK